MDFTSNAADFAFERREARFDSIDARIDTIEASVDFSPKCAKIVISGLTKAGNRGHEVA
ncbi:MAG: hypothetical protein WBD74_10805 [Candidatus Aquilonibacter sp.]